MTTITHRQAEIVATEAVAFMAKKAGTTEAAILQALGEGHKATVNYFVQLLELGGRQVANA